MWGRKNDQDGIALEDIETGRPVRSKGQKQQEVVMEYDFKPVRYKDFVTKKKYIPWWILGIITAVILILFTVYHDKIVEFLRPVSEKIRNIPAGWLIPIAILIIISFPPLFGHEIVALLCGLVYGLGIGFAVVAAGTFLGEIGTWYAFKHLFRAKALKLERTNLNYGAMARLTREGGFVVILLIRLSVIPSHLSTAVFSTCDVKFWHFAVATFLTLPKQIILVYFGVLLVETGESSNNKISGSVLFVTFLITVVAAVYIYMKMSKIKKLLIQEQEAKRMEKEALRGEEMAAVELLRSTTPDHGDDEVYRSDLHRQDSPDAYVAKPIGAHWQENGRSEQRGRVAPQEFI